MEKKSVTFLFLSQVVGVAQAINKKSGNGGTFTEKDEKVTKPEAGMMPAERDSFSLWHMTSGVRPC